MTPEQKLRARADRGQRAGELMDEFLSAALDDARAEYMAALTKLAVNEPWEAGKITKLAVAQNVIDKIEQHLRVAVLDGREAQREFDRAAQIASIPDAKRRWI